jgi:hypothetical protein
MAETDAKKKNSNRMNLLPLTVSRNAALFAM